MDEQFVSIGKTAKMLGMSIDGLRKWEREGRLIPVRGGKTSPAMGRKPPPRRRIL